MASSGKVAIPIFLLVSIVCTVSVIYGALEMSDGERSALDVLQDLLSGKLSLKDIWNALTGKDAKAKGGCAGPDTNGVYEFDVDGNCIKKGCKLGYFEQGGICLKRRDLSDEFDGGTIPIDCTISGYTYSDCKPKVNRNCGVGAGTRQKYPTVLDGFAAMAGGECEPITEVDCDIECPTECSVLPKHYSSVVGAACYGSKTDNTIVELSTETGFCGSGEESLQFIPGNISLQDAQEANFATVQEYLEYANPYGVCEQIKPTSPTACTVDCNQTASDGNSMKNIGCNYGRTEYAYITDTSGQAICFNTESVNKYLNPAIGEVSNKPTKLATIEASSAKGTDGSYDMSLIPEAEKRGVHLLYRASNNLSFEDLVKNNCHLYDTEPCDAPLEDVDCVMGLSTPRDDLACTYNGCGQQGYKTLTYVVKTHPFGGGDLCPTEDDGYEFTQIQEEGCSAALRCCGDSDYVAGECDSDGINRYTLDTTYCDNRDTQIPISKDVNCCYQSDWTSELGWDGCFLDGGEYRRKKTRTVSDTCVGDNAVTEKLDELCSYDCKLTELELKHTGKIVTGGMGCIQRYNEKEITSIEFRDPKGGTACPNVVPGETFRTSDALKTKLGDLDSLGVSVPISDTISTRAPTGVEIKDFKCGSWRFGSQLTCARGYPEGKCDNGYNCGAGDRFSGQVGWARKPPFHKQC